MNIDEFIEHAKEKAREHRYHADFFESDNPMRTACTRSAEDCEQLAEWLEKSKEYQQLEEQGLLLRLPCKVGDTVYRINKGAKEPIIKMRVLQVHFKQLHKNRTIIRIDTINDNDMGENCYLLEDFGKTVFLTQAEAEAKLKERCDSKVSENDDTKNKVTSLEIIVRMIDNKPYYEIKYKKVGEDYCHVGYSSFNIDNVLKWRDECFELVDVKTTNADRIRNMSDDELAEFIEQISTDSMETISFGTKEYKEIWERKETALEWLQSEAE